ncbi:MAG: hypothetical protein KC776_41490 [Myxococcales bacterium]|nr:hypothetical protein [Myxococcales bacterium]MCB9583332.1 hypothetical protein [Polyangiaceae bacterium]
MPRCYLLALCSGSSLDQQSNNVTLFNLVEQLNVPPNAPPPPGGVLPLEIHAYFSLTAEELNQPFEVRFAVVSESGLELYTDPFRHRSVTPRYRTRTLGLPFPAVFGMYEVRIDMRPEGTGEWQRASIAWPLTVIEASQKPQLTH